MRISASRLFNGSARLAFALVALAASMLLLHGTAYVRAQTLEGAGAQAAAGEEAADEGDDAQADEDQAAGTSEQQAVDRQSLGGLILSSSGFSAIFYIILGIFSLVAMTVTFERLVNLRRDKVMPTAFVQELRDLISRQQDNEENLRQLTERYPSPIALILKGGVFRAGRPLPEVEKAMEDEAAKEISRLRGRNRPLAVVSNVAPLVGLLGTVVGMIFAFQISSQEGLGKAERLAEGIYLALMTTAAGLSIAIPCMLLSAWFNGLVERYMRDVDECLLETLPAFTRMEQMTHVPQPREVQSDREATAVVS